MTKDNEKPIISGKRRAFVKGAAVSAPVILTLRSGAAFAETSSEVCIARDNTAAVSMQPTVLTPVDDNWVRRPIACRTLVDPDNLEPPFLVYNNVGAVDTDWGLASNIPGGSSNVFYELYEGSSDPEDPFAGLYVLQGISPPTKGYSTDATPDTCYILVHIETIEDVNADLSSLPVGNSGSTANGLPYVMGSCWSSLRAMS